jgi:hypothetical protein
MIPKIYYKLTQYSPALHMKSHHFIDLHENPWRNFTYYITKQYNSDLDIILVHLFW